MLQIATQNLQRALENYIRKCQELSVAMMKDSQSFSSPQGHWNGNRSNNNNNGYASHVNNRNGGRDLEAVTGQNQNMAEMMNTFTSLLQGIAFQHATTSNGGQGKATTFLPIFMKTKASGH